jgi:type I restriction enzyme, S subunit
MEFLTSTIGKIAKEIKTGKTPPTKNTAYFNGAINWYTPTDLDRESYLGKSTRTITELAVNDKKATLFSSNTVLIGCIGNIGKIGIIDEPASSNQQITGVLTDESKVIPEFFFYWLKMNKKLLEKNSKKAVVPILNNKQLSAIPISYPKNIEDQKRIAQVLVKTELLISQRKESIELTDDFLKHTFLTMFGDPNNNKKKWRLEKLSKVTKSLNSKRVPIKQQDRGKISGAYPYYGATGIVDYINDYKFDGSHLLISEDGKNLLLRKKPLAFMAKGKFWVNNHAHVLDEIGSMRLRYLEFHLNLMDISKFVTGIDQFKLNKNNLDLIEVMSPSINMQNEFVSIVDQIEKLQTYFRQSLNEFNELYRSLSHKAFNGELTIIENIEEEEVDDGYRSYVNDRTEPWHFGLEEIVKPKVADEIVLVQTEKKEKIPVPIIKIPFLKTEKDLIYHISKNCSSSHFTFEDIKVALKDLDWKYDFEELKSLVFNLVRKNQLKQVFGDASYKSSFDATDANFKEIKELSEKIYFKRVL